MTAPEVAPLSAEEWTEIQAYTGRRCLFEKRLIATVEAQAAREQRLRTAITAAGYAVMETSGAWSIHDVREDAKKWAARDGLMIDDNLRLERRVAELEDELEVRQYALDEVAAAARYQIDRKNVALRSAANRFRAFVEIHRAKMCPISSEPCMEYTVDPCEEGLCKRCAYTPRQHHAARKAAENAAMARLCEAAIDDPVPYEECPSCGGDPSAFCCEARR